MSDTIVQREFTLDEKKLLLSIQCISEFNHRSNYNPCSCCGFFKVAEPIQRKMKERILMMQTPPDNIQVFGPMDNFIVIPDAAGNIHLGWDDK